MKTIGIAGGSGFVGSYITRELTAKGYSVIIFSRNPVGQAGQGNVSYALLDAATGRADTTALAKVDAAINLAGAGIADKRWTDARKKEIVDSRVDTTRFFVEQLRAHAPNCSTFVAASAIGYYGQDQPHTGAFTEDMPPADNFLGHTCKLWEAASLTAAGIMRAVIIRIGVVLGKEGGALAEFVKPMRAGLMTILGGGMQEISWIAVEDLARLFVYAAENGRMSGAYNGVAPAPVNQARMMHAIKEVKGGLAIPVPVPAIALKLAMGEMSQVVLESCTVSPVKTEQTGFTYKYPTIETALKQILGSN